MKVVKAKAIALENSKPVASEILDLFDGIVLMPTRSFSQVVVLRLADSVDPNSCLVDIVVDCSDLAGVTEHSFRYSPVPPMLCHSFGFSSAGNQQ